MKRFNPSQSFSYSNYQRRRLNKTAKALGVEKKFMDVIRGSNDISQVIAGSECDPATQMQISGVAIGDGARSRDGRTITIKSIHVNGCITSYTPQGRNVRVLLVLDKQTNGAQFNAEDVLLATGSSGTDNFTYRNLDFIKRFVVCKDLTFQINPEIQLGESALHVERFTINYPCNIEVNYRAGGDTIADVTDNSFHLMAFADGNDTTLRYVARTRFVG